MENNNSETAPHPSTQTKPQNRSKLIMAVAAIVIIGLVATAFLASGLLSKPTDNEGSWLFKGAYAKYEGSTSVLGFGLDFSVKLEVLDYNSTHAYMSTSFKMQTSIGEMAEEENDTWVELSQIGFSNAFSESNVTRSYDATLDFGNIGTRSCTVYEFATDGPTMIFYVDKEIGWPLKIKATMTGEDSVSLSIDINLVDTNIPALE